MIYNRSKPATYCLLFSSFCNSFVNDTYYSIKYDRKLGEITDDSKNHVNETSKYKKHLVTKFLNRALSIRDLLMDYYSLIVTIAD